METSRSTTWRAAAAGIAAALVATAGFAMAPAAAVEDVETARLAGDDRFETAAAIADAAHPTGTNTAIIATARKFPDALAAAALAGGLNAPILLTEVDSLPTATTDALEDLGVEDVIIVGGTGVVSKAVFDELDETYDVLRLAGLDRYATAGLIAEAIGTQAVAELDGLRTAIVATGRNFPDALAGGTLAAEGAGASGVHPILLTDTGVPDATADAIDELGIEQVVILGGTGAVSTSVENELEDLTGNDAVRLAGNDRTATAIAVAEAAAEDFGFDATEVLLANSLDFPDALAGGPLGAIRSAPLLLTNPTTLSGPTRTYLEEHADVVETITALGGTAAISNSTLSAAETAAETEQVAGADEGVTVTPSTAERLDSDGTRAYTATGLGTTAVDIVLVDCARVNRGSTTSFENVNRNAVADGTADEAAEGEEEDQSDTRAAITSVNGSSRNPDNPLINDDYVDGAQPQNGTVTFEVSGPGGTSGSTCVVPVVFVDANQDDALNSTTTNPAAPTEELGTGGPVTFSPAAAAAGTIDDVNVETTHKGENRFSACAIEGESGTNELVNPDDCASYTYDTNDIFEISSTRVSMDQFERALSPDDDVKGSFAAEPSGVSTFNLTDEGPRAPGEPEAENDGDDVVVEFQESPTSTVDSYRLYRAAAGGTVAEPACPEYDTSAGRAAYSVEGTADDPSTLPLPTSTITITDTDVPRSKTFCYVVVAVDEGDESTSAGPATVTTPAAPTTPTPPAATGPTIEEAIGQSANDDLDAGDVHRLTFSEALAKESAVSGSYTVEDDNPGAKTTVVITCGDNADCALNSAGTVLTVRITTSPLSPGGGMTNPGLIPGAQYDLEITDTEGMQNADGEEVDLAASADTTIENAGASAVTSDSTGPFITQAQMEDATGGPGFGALGDTMLVTFSEPVFVNDADGVLTETQVEAILGSAIAYAQEGSISIERIDADTIGLNVVHQLSEGIGVGETVDGTNNRNILDPHANQQIANPDKNPTLMAAS